MRAKILELHQKGQSADEISKTLSVEFGKSACSKSTIYYWIRKAKVGITDVSDAPRAGRPLDEELIVKVQTILEEEPFASINYIARTLDSNKATIYRYVTEHLGRVYKHARWVPHLLTDEQKNEKSKRMRSAL